MANVYYEKDVKYDALAGKTVSVIGYGSQGRAQSRNLKDSGVKVLVGLRKDGKSWQLAMSEGMEVVSIEEASEKGDVIQILLPDQIQQAVYDASIRRFLFPGKALGFSHGFNIHYHQIVPPEGVDVFMVAPKGPGPLVRRMFEEGKGVPSLIAVHKDFSGKAKDIALSYAKAIGSLRSGVIETTFKEETETDLFGEQAVLCGGVNELIKDGFEVLVEAGYQPEIAYFECLNELKLIVDLIYEGGIINMWKGVSDTAKYGGLTVGPKIITEEVKKLMKEALKRVQNGEFAREWVLENKSGQTVLKASIEAAENHSIEKVGKALRDMMPWIKREE
ncbi:MAG: ketol-acid reductoisomerase [bacterium]